VCSAVYTCKLSNPTMSVHSTHIDAYTTCASSATTTTSMCTCVCVCVCMLVLNQCIVDGSACVYVCVCMCVQVCS
jgi:hypothetical protein